MGGASVEVDEALSGGDEGIRTLDLLSAIQALFRAELRPHTFIVNHLVRGVNGRLITISRI